MSKFLVLLLFLINVCFAQTLEGHSFASVIGLGGILKSALVEDIFPVGSIVGTSGHEVYDFSKYSQYDNRQAYCFSSLDFALDANFLGLYFGGEASKVYTMGSCEMKPKALVGEDLVLFVSIDPAKGTKSLPIGIAINFGFDMDGYLDQMRYRFFNSYLSNRSSGERLKRLHRHILKYIAMNATKSLLTKEELLFAKLLGFPFVARSLKDQSIVDLIKPTESDYLYLKNLKNLKNKLSISNILRNFYDKARKDVNFYSCKNYSECEEIYVDFLQFYEILINSFDDCGSINIYAGLLSEFSLKYTDKMKFEIGFGYSRTEFNKSYNSNYSTSTLAFGEFAKHNFSKRSQACEEIGKKTGENFGQFLGFLK